MILTSASDDFAQTEPVTTTYSPDTQHTWARRLPRKVRGRLVRLSVRATHDVTATSWDRMAGLYEFCRTRTLERLHEAEQHEDVERTLKATRDLEVLEAMYVQASTHNDVVVACAVTYFRATALRDAHHHEFLGEWIGPRALHVASHERSSVAC
jgi:hypothetical protein